jgi:hypothetical protein
VSHATSPPAPVHRVCLGACACSLSFLPPFAAGHPCWLVGGGKVGLPLARPPSGPLITPAHPTQRQCIGGSGDEQGGQLVTGAHGRRGHSVWHSAQVRAACVSPHKGGGAVVPPPPRWRCVRGGARSLAPPFAGGNPCRFVVVEHQSRVSCFSLSPCTPLALRTVHRRRGGDQHRRVGGRWPLCLAREAQVKGVSPPTQALRAAALRCASGTRACRADTRRHALVWWVGFRGRGRGRLPLCLARTLK